MSLQERLKAFPNRSDFGLPSLSGTVQYGFGVFEGGKAFPQPDGSVKLFRPDQNAQRFDNSLQGMYLPSPGKENIQKAIIQTVKRNVDLGFFARYDDEYKKDRKYKL
jgi:branched-chain amino acid aminotransferase